jgi:phosphoglucosamine mutase
MLFPDPKIHRAHAVRSVTLALRQHGDAFRLQPPLKQVALGGVCGGVNQDDLAHTRILNERGNAGGSGPAGKMPGVTRLFGTDGVRGVANRDLTPELALALGQAAVQVLGREPRPTIVVGRDTRASGEFLEAALCAGLCSAGADVVRAGVVPAPAVAFLTVDTEARMGVVISASHNPPEYNGIKLFSADGTKFPDEVEREMESLVETGGAPRPEGAALGRVTDSADVAERYLEHLVTAVNGTLGGMHVVIDCANGAAYRLGPEILSRLGAEVYAINDEPDGANINVGSGATHPEAITEAVRSFGAEAGVAHDGDADRAILSDADGNVVDGDQILATAAIAYKQAGRLTHDTVVSTVMANLGFRKTMAEEGIDVVETQVGDRYVLEEMLRRGAVLGGEQSGHIIFRDQATTGDGLLTAAWFLSEARRRGATVAELAATIPRYPQVLQNVPVTNLASLDDASAVWEAVRLAEEALGDRGRVLVRASGTEPLIRVMVEAETEENATRYADAISAVVRSSLG